MIDSLATGFGVVTRRPILVLLPVLLDIALLTAPGVTSEALASRVHVFLSGALTGATTNPDTLLTAGIQLGQVQEGLVRWNLLGVLAWQVPTLTGALLVVRTGQVLWPVNVTGWSLLLLTGLAAISILLACLYLGRLALAVRMARPAISGQARESGIGQQPPLAGLLWTLGSVGRNWARLVGLRVIQGGTLLVLLLLGLGVLALGPGVAGVLTILVAAVAVMVLLFLFLAEESVFLNGSSTWGAVVDSVRTVRNNFGATVGLWLLVTVIGIGLRLVWLNITGSVLGDLVAIAGNAYIVTGLAAAVLVFYADRTREVLPAGVATGR